MNRSNYVAIIAVAGVMNCSINPLQAQTVHTIELSGMRFTPPAIDINIGDTVRWRWVSGFHNVESGTIVSGTGVADGNFRSGNPTGTAGTIFDLVFDQAFINAHPMSNNVYPYYCIVHAFSNMAGVVSVLITGDIDGDSDIDLTDHKLAATCMSGPGNLLLPNGCSIKHQGRADIDGDGDVDLRDWSVIQNNMTGK